MQHTAEEIRDNQTAFLFGVVCATLLVSAIFWAINESFDTGQREIAEACRDTHGFIVRYDGTSHAFKCDFVKPVEDLKKGKKK